MVAEDCWERAVGGSKKTAIAIRKNTRLQLDREKNRNMVPLWTA